MGDRIKFEIRSDKHALSAEASGRLGVWAVLALAVIVVLVGAGLALSFR